MPLKYSQKIQLEILRKVAEHGEFCMTMIDLKDPKQKWNYDYLVDKGCIDSPTGYENEPGMRVDYHKGLTEDGEVLLYKLSDLFRKDDMNCRMSEMTWQIRGLTLGLCLMTVILLVLTWILVCR